MNARTLFAVAGSFALASAALAQETIDFVALAGGPVNTGGNVGTGTASTRAISTTNFTYTFANSFLWAGSVTINGVLRQVTGGNFANESRIVVTSPSNGGTSATTDAQLFTSGSFTGTIAGTRTQSLGGFTGAPFNVGGQTFSFRFYESFNDGGTLTDAVYDALTITFNAFVPPTPPACTDLGAVSNSSYPAVQSGSLASGQVQWYCFTVAANTVLDIHTYLSTNLSGGQLDTEIGLYNSLGQLVATNDDLNGGLVSGQGNFNSGISTGGGSGVDLDGSGPGVPLGNAAMGTNVPGFLAAGTYYLAVAGFNSAFNNDFGVTGGTAAGNFNLTLIPTPGAVAVLGLGALVAGRRRRA
jgi:MYXO-CTERM domain-containing protein